MNDIFHLKEFMKILCITNQKADYLADAFIIGLKQLYKKEAIEYKTKKILYKTSDLSEVRGNGFTLYQILPQTIQSELSELTENELNQFDLIIFTSIYRQYDTFLKILPFLKKEKTILLDGEDKANIFLYAGAYWKKLSFWRNPKPHKLFTYFKREITDKTNQSLYFKLLPSFLTYKLPLHKNIKQIGFGIPSEKICTFSPTKTKLFPIHIVDEEIASKNEGSKTSYGFDNEESYYADLQQSKFGITTKRGGWDCLRHYEIAANASVMCFKHLNKKPISCAPHGLIDGVNCISYDNYDDLMHKINQLSDEQYNELQKNTLIWVKNNTCKEVVKNTLKEFNILKK